MIIDNTFLGDVAKHQFMQPVPFENKSYVSKINSAARQLSGGMLKSPRGHLFLKSADEQQLVGNIKMILTSPLSYK